MKKSSKIYNILILLALNIILIFIEYFLLNDYIVLICEKWYLCVLMYLINCLIINPFVAYLIDYYLIAKYI